ncbi:MAG: hypothetical protein M5U28_31425 [Sandaracinaceae bacterium]|nr:hypothetical protein [Sandaracinaceae bacterium]
MSDAHHPLLGRAGDGPRRRHRAHEVRGRSERLGPVLTRSARFPGSRSEERGLVRPRMRGGDEPEAG